MVSFISALSLFILVLSNGCFTLPILEEQLLSSTFLPLNNDLTTEHAINLRLVSDDETTVLPNLEIKRLSDEHIGFVISTSTNNLSVENASRLSRTFNELSTSEPLIITTEQSPTNKRHHHDILFTTIEPVTQVSEHEIRSVKIEDETDIDKREMQVDLTTDYMPSFTSTSSAVAPELYTLELSTLTSTEKYIGHLIDEKEDVEVEVEQQPKKSVKIPKTTIKKVSQVQPIDQSNEDLKESTIPTAVFDQEALKKVSNVPNDFMVLDETNDVVTDLPNKLSTTIMENKEERKLLNQGSTLVLFLIAALLFCACLTASTLACVKNRHTLKRKSRIIEMEAHLDEHYQHYPHSLVFQQHYEK